MIDRVGGKATRLAGTPGGPGALGIFQLPGDKATEADLDVLKQLPGVFDLALEGPAFGDATAPKILEFAKLATLRLKGKSFGDATIQAILPHPMVRILILDDVAIGTAGFAALGTSATMEFLDLQNMTISPEHFTGLKELRGFREIRFRNCQFDEAELKKLQEMLPECDVVDESAKDKAATQ